MDVRDRFYVTMSPGASLRFSLPISQMFGFLDDNFSLTLQYKDGRFQIQQGFQRMSLVWVQQPGLPLRFEISLPQGTGNYNPRPFSEDGCLFHHIQFEHRGLVRWLQEKQGSTRHQGNITRARNVQECALFQVSATEDQRA